MTQRQNPEGFPSLIGVWTFVYTDEAVAPTVPSASDSVIVWTTVCCDIYVGH